MISRIVAPISVHVDFKFVQKSKDPFTSQIRRPRPRPRMHAVVDTVPMSTRSRLVRTRLTVITPFFGAAFDCASSA